MISAGIGIGTGGDAHKAGRDAAADALESLPGRTATAVVVFGSVSFDQDQLLAGIAEITGKAAIVGCSTAGEISSEGLAGHDSVVVAAIGGDGLSVTTAIGNHLLWNARQAGLDCAKELQYVSHGYLDAGLVFTDVVAGKGEIATTGIEERLGPSIPLFGAAAGDDLLFYKTYQYLNGRAFTGSVVALGLHGDAVSCGTVADGFLPIGIPRTITHANGVLVREIDGKPAISMYEDYFGPTYATELKEHLLSDLAVTFPLGILSPGEKRMIPRTPMYADGKGGMIFSAPIPEGAEAHIMISDSEQTIASAKAAAEEILRRLDGRTPRLVLLFNSIARRKLLGTNADEEIHVIQNVMGREVPMAGFYGYAQIDSSATLGTNFHNAGLGLWVLADR